MRGTGRSDKRGNKAVAMLLREEKAALMVVRLSDRIEGLFGDTWCKTSRRGEPVRRFRVQSGAFWQSWLRRSFFAVRPWLLLQFKATCIPCELCVSPDSQ